MSMQERMITSKSSNSSVSSILKDPSSPKPKKQHTVRFEDGPLTGNKTIQIKPQENNLRLYSPTKFMHSNNYPVCPSKSPVLSGRSPLPTGKMPLSSSKASISPPKSPLILSKSPSPTKSVNNYLTKSQAATIYTESDFPNDVSSVKSVAINGFAMEAMPGSINEPRFAPKVLNYAFRTSNFYDKLNKFYQGTSGTQSRAEKAAENEPYSKIGKGKTEGRGDDSAVVISLGGMSRNSNHSRGASRSPIRDSKSPPKKKPRNAPGHNILN